VLDDDDEMVAFVSAAVAAGDVDPLVHQSSRRV